MLLAWRAAADEAPAPDKSGYWLLEPTPEDQLRQFSPERPGKSHNPYSVDAGQVQIELDAFDYTYDHSSFSDQTTRAVTLGAPVLKLGIADRADIELGFAPYNVIHVTDRRTGLTSAGEGFGNLALGTKLNLFGNDGGDQAMAVIAFVDLPTAARNVGDNVVEYALDLPYSFSLPGDWGLTLEPDFSIVENVQNSGYHLNVSEAVSLSHSVLSDDVTAQAEIYVAESGDRHTGTIATFDPALSWAVRPDVQLDGGIYLGLTRAAPALEPYIGISYRF